MNLRKSKQLISSIFILLVPFFLFSFLAFLLFSFLVFPSVVEAADIEAVTDSTDGSSAFAVKNSSSVEQAHIDSTGNLVAKGCVRVDSGLVECSETEGLIVDGNVGLGTVNPLSKLQVVGGLTRFGLAGTINNVSGTGEVYVQSNLEVDGIIYGDASGLFNLPAGAGGWTDGGTNVYTTITTDAVGIGTTTPNAATLEIVKQSSTIPFKISSVATGSGDYLIVRSGGNVGIGTVLPSATLTVNGTLSMEPSGTTNITAGGGVTAVKMIMRIQGSGGAVDISVNPQIASGADGQLVILQGMSNANTVFFENGTGLRLQEAVSFTLGLADVLTLMYDSSVGSWTEIVRVDN